MLILPLTPSPRPAPDRAVQGPAILWLRVSGSLTPSRGLPSHPTERRAMINASAAVLGHCHGWPSPNMATELRPAWDLPLRPLRPRYPSRPCVGRFASRYPSLYNASSLITVIMMVAAGVVTVPYIRVPGPAAPAGAHKLVTTFPLTLQVPSPGRGFE